MSKKKKAGKVDIQDVEPVAESAVPSVRVWDRRWFPAALFLCLSALYFHQFVVSDNVIYGYDAGLDFRLGEGMTFLEKVETVAQPMWHMQMGGLPQSEEIRPQYFPTYPIYFFTSFHRYLGWRYILTMFCAGLGMYVFLRQIEITRWAALWGGIAYMSAPTLMAFTFAGQYAKMGVIALYPWMWYFLDRGLAERRIIHFVGLGVVIAWGIYSPHPKMLYYALCGTGLFFIFRTYQWYLKERDKGWCVRRIVFFVTAIVLGLGLGAEGTYPLYSYTGSESKRAAGKEGSGRTDEEQLAYAQSWSLHPEEVASLVIPEFGGFNLPKEGRSTYWGRNPRKDNSEYFGVLVVVLALLAVIQRRRDPLVIFLCAGFVLSLAYTLGGHTPVHWLAYHLLPGIKLFRAVGMAAYLFAFPACVLAAMGLHRLLEVDAENEPIQQKRLMLVAGTIAGIALLVAMAPEGMTSLWNGLFYSDITAQRARILQVNLDWLSRGSTYVVLVVLGGLTALLLRIKGVIGTGTAIVALSILSLCDTWRINQVFLKYENPSAYADLRQANVQAKRLMRADGELFRVLPLPEYHILKQDGLQLDGIASITGFHDLTVGRYDRLLRDIEPVTNLFWSKYAMGREIPYTDADLLGAIHPLINLLNGKYLVVPRGITMALPADRFPLLGEADNYRIYENLQALPWCYLAPSAQVVTDEDQAIEMLRSGQIDPASVALIEAPLPFELSQSGDTSNDRVEVVEHSPGEGIVRLQTHSPEARLLVLSENYQSNWSVWVDGQEADIRRANYVWKGVALAAGDHQVEFRYSSPALFWSRLVTILCVLGVVGLLVKEFIYERKGDRSIRSASFFL